MTGFVNRNSFAFRSRIIITVNGIKVTSYIPENVSESVKRNRINQIYDILKPAEKEEENEDKEKGDKTA